MEFKTEVVRTWEPSWPIRILALVLFLGAAYFLFIDEGDLAPGVKIIIGLFYFAGIFLGLGQPFLKPKRVGTFKIDSSEIKVESPDVQKRFDLSEVKDITLKYSGYGSWWSHSIYGNKNFILITNQEGELLQFEILIKSKDHKKLLKQLLSERLVGVSFSSIKTGAAEF